VILLDTSGVLAALFPDQREHAACARALLEAEPPRILSPFIIAELDYLILKYGGIDAEITFLEDLETGSYELATFEYHDMSEARRVVERYRDLRIGLADASLVVLAERYDTRDLLTLDERHFRAMRPTTRRSFRILPADVR
jgi:predicted nucleic acid-binding protein